MNLSASRWAPRNWRTQQSASGLGLGLGVPRTGVQHKPDVELSKHKKLLARLKWKSSLLIISHQRVTQAMQAPTTGPHDSSATEAETMFKLDFFEYYVLLERVILHLLGVFNISVSPHVVEEQVNHNNVSRDDTAKDISINGAPIIGTSTYDRSYYNHRFHANVLQALDRPTNPLHTALGTGDVREYLGIAKESRNRWKDAEEEESQGIRADAIPGSGALKHQRMLKNVDLEVMLACIVEALAKAQGIAEEHIRTGGRGPNGALETLHVGVAMEYEMEDAPLEVTPDVMEWEEF
jgi:hypothetical protein